MSDNLTRLLALAIVSAYFIYVSRKSLLLPQSHGFYRFFAWEAMLALVLLNIPYWVIDPFSVTQIVSWVLLLISIFLVAYGTYLLKVFGKPDQNRANSELLAFEKTTMLVSVGIFKYIRHPLYSSLLFLAWGAYLKLPSIIGLLLALVASFFLFLTAKCDEAECLQHFGNAYAIYMAGTKRFVPFVF